MTGGSGDVPAPQTALARRARRLLRRYPPAWRQRYGPGFTELLLAGLQPGPMPAARR